MHCASDLIYIELRYLHVRLTSAGYKSRRNDFITRWFRCLSGMGVPPAHMERASTDDGMLPFDVVSTFAFLMLLSAIINAGNQIQLKFKVVVVDVLRRLSVGVRAVQLAHPHDIRIVHGTRDFSLSLTTVGRVANWEHMLISMRLLTLWRDCTLFMHLGCIIDSPISSPTLDDAVTFAAIAVCHLQSEGGIRHAVMWKTLTVLATLVGQLFGSRVVAAIGMLTTPIEPRPPLLRRGTKRPALIDPHVVFNLLAKASRMNSTPRQVLKFNNDRDEWRSLSLNPSDKWSLRELDMYMRNARDAMHAEVQLSISFDPSTYNGEETMVSQIYSWMKDIACQCIVQIVPRGKHISVNEIPMSDGFAAIVLQRRQERWASFKEMRALSAQLSDITRQRMSLDSFCLPDGVIARCVRVGEKRVVLNNIAVIATLADNVVTGREVEMPLRLNGVRFPLLVAAMDQGGIGTAGVYFAVGHLGLMISPRWDRYHRGVNDMKLATQHALGGLFRRVLLLTTFLFQYQLRTIR